MGERARDIIVEGAIRWQGRELYPSSWALVVGVNRFASPKIAPLGYAENDAQAVARMLGGLGFPERRTILLRGEEATRDAIDRVLRSRFVRETGERDRVFIFFATHGVTRPLPAGGEEGFLLPFDVDVGDLAYSAFSMRQLREICQRFPAKHTLIAVDACYGGFTLVRSQAPPAVHDRYLDLLMKARGIQVLAAGQKDEPVIEDQGHGVFTRKLIEGLEGFADEDGDGLITATALASWMHKRVAQASDYKQNMQFGSLEGEGQFVFVLPEVKQEPRPVKPPPRPPEPREEPKEVGITGPPMVEFPAGWFIMGSNEYADEKPQRRVYLDAFWIDKYPVTNEWYGRFMRATGRKAPGYWGDEKFNAPKQPVVGVTWHDADAFCKWLGRRLPTEAEWEKAARGTDGRKYPWGNEWDPNRAIFEGNSGGKPHPVDRTYNTHASPYGAVDMAGNVWQWVADWYEKDYYGRAPERNPKGPERGQLHVLRGGSWNINPRLLRAAYRSGYGPVNRDDFAGFRCAGAP